MRTISCLCKKIYIQSSYRKFTVYLTVDIICVKNEKFIIKILRFTEAKFNGIVFCVKISWIIFYDADQKTILAFTDTGDKSRSIITASSREDN